MKRLVLMALAFTLGGVTYAADQKLAPEVKKECQSKLYKFWFDFYKTKITAIKKTTNLVIEQLSSVDQSKILELKNSKENEKTLRSNIRALYEELDQAKKAVSAKETDTVGKVKSGTLTDQDQGELQRLASGKISLEQKLATLVAEKEAASKKNETLHQELKSRLNELFQGAYVKKEYCDWDCAEVALEKKKQASTNPLNIILSLHEDGTLKIHSFFKEQSRKTKVFKQTIDLDEVYVVAWLTPGIKDKIRMSFDPMAYAADYALIDLLAKTSRECKDLNYDGSGGFNVSFEVAL